jgi:hypothetical protein
MNMKYNNLKKKNCLKEYQPMKPVVNDEYKNYNPTKTEPVFSSF